VLELENDQMAVITKALEKAKKESGEEVHRRNSVLQYV
jgi:hypothetical protein